MHSLGETGPGLTAVRCAVSSGGEHAVAGQLPACPGATGDALGDDCSCADLCPSSAAVCLATRSPPDWILVLLSVAVLSFVGHRHTGFGTHRPPAVLVPATGRPRARIGLLLADLSVART